MFSIENIKIALHHDQKVSLLTVDRPEARNSLNLDTIDSFLKILHEQDRNPNVRVIILTGAGDKVFISGLDIREVKDLTGLQYRNLGEKLVELVQKILGLGKPVIAMVNGHALGGGCLLALMSDLVVASEKAHFGWPEINVGLLGGMQLMVPLVGKVRAAELCFTGRAITAPEALSLGLVNRIVPPNRLQDETMGLALELAQKSPIALKLAKRALRTAFEDGPRIATMLQLELVSLCFSSLDQKEAMAAFLEKRKPVYAGK